MKRFVHSLILAAALLMPLGLPPVAAGTGAGAMSPMAGPAIVADAKGDACAGIGLSGGNCNGSSTGINNVITTLVNVLTGIVGVVAVIMIIIGGFKYVTSGGDANKVSSAKSTIIYAIVGLIVVALAELIVHFVVLSAR